MKKLPVVPTEGKIRLYIQNKTQVRNKTQAEMGGADNQKDGKGIKASKEREREF